MFLKRQMTTKASNDTQDNEHNVLLSEGEFLEKKAQDNFQYPMKNMTTKYESQTQHNPLLTFPKNLYRSGIVPLQL